MAGKFRGWCRVALAASSVLLAAPGCGQSFTASDGSGGASTTSTAGGAGGNGGVGGTTASTAGGGGGSTTSSGCADGATMACYEGRAGTESHAPCHGGMTTCHDGEWGECVGQVIPAAQDACAGVDDDCNGMTDEDCACTATTSEICYSGPEGTLRHSPCASGTRMCGADGKWGPCMGDITPEPEQCDDIDNNCNGANNETYPEKGTSCDIDTCNGVFQCAEAELKCSLVPTEAAEICDDAVDNDCDSVTDPEPLYPFVETFDDGGDTWGRDKEWTIASAVPDLAPSPGFNGDPAFDHTGTITNFLAGVVIGGKATVEPHEAQYLTSPKVDLTLVPGPLVLSFWRFLNSDARPKMTSSIEVFDGSDWVVLWKNSDTDPVADSVWTPQAFNVTPYKNKDFQVRFGVAVGDGCASVGSWSVDDVTLSSCAEPTFSNN